jgi:glyoxalase family protein
MSKEKVPQKPSKAINGNHHITGVTGDVVRNVDFWSRLMGLKFIKKTLNFETTFRYHTYFSDGEGARGSVVTFLEFNDVPKARPGKGNHFAAMLRVRSNEALDFWQDRLTQNEVFSELIRLNPTQPRRLLFQDFEGHNVELIVSDAKDAPQAAPASDIPAEFRITGIEGIRSCATLDDLAPYALHMGGVRNDAMGRWEINGSTRSARWYTAPVPNLPFQEFAAGVWHHLAIDADDQLQGWRDWAHAGPIPTTPVYDHYVFDSAYTMTPGGVIELCNDRPGLTFDQKPEELGERLALAPRVEPLRRRLETELTQIHNPRNPDGTLKAEQRVAPARAA